jgi:hypothetical protein
MPIQEYLVRSPAELASPGGLTSPGWSKTQAAEIVCWQAATRGLWAEMRAGRYIMVMVFVRTGVAKWNDASKNFAFDPKMDAILAAYSVAPSVGQPYKPGTCLEMFVKSTIAASAMGAALSAIALSDGLVSADFDGLPTTASRLL